MGIDTRYYTVYGVKIDYNDELSEELYETDLYNDVEKEDDLSIISDGMGGDYMVIGKVLFEGGNLRWGDDGDVFEVIPIGDLSNYRLDVTQAFARLFPDFTHLLDSEWNLMTFVHYS